MIAANHAFSSTIHGRGHIASARGVLRAGTLALLAVAALALAACATTGALEPSVKRLTATEYPPTQMVDILTVAPSRAYERIAQLRVDDPTGTATSSQMRAQLVAAARDLGANALVMGTVSRSGGDSVEFNPSGGLMQNAAGAGAVSLSALAIRYVH